MIKKILKWIGLLLLLVLLLIGLFIYNTFAQFDKLKQGELQENFTQDTIPFRFHPTTGHILIDVKINNSDKSYPFFLDSGASNYVFKNFTKENPLAGNGFAFSMGATGNMYFTRIRKIPSLQIGAATFKALNAEESTLNWDCVDDIYGLIGADIMRHLVWEIDFRKQIIVLSKQLDNQKINSQAIKIPITGTKYTSFIDASLKFRHNRHTKQVRIDLGNSGILSMNESFLTEDGLNFKKKGVTGMGSKGLGYANNNMSLNEKYYLVDSLIFNNGEYAIKNIPIKASPNNFNLLGLGFFKVYKTTISWQDKVILLAPYDTVQNFVQKTYGFSTEYNEQKNIVEVESITENMPASKAGLPLFSEVVSINQKTFTDVQSYCDYSPSKSTNDTMNIVIRHNDSIQEFTLVKTLLFD
ncbi:MAG: hypothetical protein AB8G86_29915 [Saprospiraceae bacterium]